MTKTSRRVKVAVVQAAPVLFDLPATLQKIQRLVQDCASAGARLVLFPEAFIPAYPRGLSFGMVVGQRSQDGRNQWQRFYEEAVEIPGEVTKVLGAASREAGIHTVVGVVERETRVGRGTLYCTLLYFGPDGELLHRHRKLKPTGSERLIWGEGDGSTLKVLETDAGRVGGLICWENYMPLARVALYAEGVEVYLAPTADPRDTWQATLRHIACEGRCFVLGCNQFVTKSMLPREWAELDELRTQPEILCRGGSVIYSPLGELLAGPVLDREEILLADLDLGEVVRAKLDFDAVGHYARPDVFQLHVNRQPAATVRFTDLDGDIVTEPSSCPAAKKEE
jgi:nitrilase